jgi:ATP-binding cassette subfamily C (CFTR/MRP) protein 1
MIPLVIKVFLTWLIEVYVYYSLSPSDQALAAAAGFQKPRGVGFGIGVAFIIFGMQGSLLPLRL